MVILPQPSATPNIWDLKNFTIWASKQLLYHPFDIQNPTIAKFLKELLTCMFWKFPTTLQKSCWDKSWKSSKFMNDLIFQIPNFLFYPLPISMLTLTKFCSQKSKAYQVLLSKAYNFVKDIDLGGKGFFHGKIDFLFCLNSFVQDSRLLIFFKKTIPNCSVVSKCMLV